MEHESTLPLSNRFQIRSIYRDACLWTLSAVLYLTSDCSKPERGGEGEDKTQVLSFYILALGKKMNLTRWASQGEWLCLIMFTDTWRAVQHDAS